MTDNLVDPKYGYVENVEDETKYKNIDYRDTTTPLWSQLHKELTKHSYLFDSRQRQINIALCAAIIQLGNSTKYYSNTIYDNIIDSVNNITVNINELNERVKVLEEKLNNLIL